MMRIQFKRTTIILLAIALGAGIIAALSTQQYIQEKVEELEAKSKVTTVQRIVAAYDLPQGTKIEAAHIAVREYPQDLVMSDSLTPEQFIQIEGQVLTATLKKGDPLLWLHITNPTQQPFSEKINVGRRAVTMPVDSINSVSGMLVPGDLIDLYVSFEYRQRQITAPLLQGVLVMATGKQSRQSDTGEENIYSTVTLDTAPEEAAKLVAARQSGHITALLRNPHDSKSVQKGIRGDLATILGIANPVVKPKKKTSVIYGDTDNKKLNALTSQKETSVNDNEMNKDKSIIEIPGQEDIVSAWINSLPKNNPISGLAEESLNSGLDQ